jgi:hypothetical protein
MTPDVYAQNLLERTGNNEIVWTRLRKDFNEKYDATVDGARVEICEASAGGVGGGIKIFLISSKDGQEKIIYEPQIHISQAPIGTILRAAGWCSRAICRFFGWRDFPEESFLKEPETPEARENERLRIALNNLYRRVVRQSDSAVILPHHR